MNKLAIFFVTFVTMFLNSSVEGQLTCFQGTRAMAAGATTGSIASSACTLDSTICFRRSETITVAGVTSKEKANAIFLSLGCFLFAVFVASKVKTG